MFSDNNNEEFSTLTEQGDFGLGVGKIKNKKDIEQIKNNFKIFGNEYSTYPNKTDNLNYYKNNI